VGLGYDDRIESMEDSILVILLNLYSSLNECCNRSGTFCCCMPNK
jgi:hypothetical protein